MPDQKFHSRSSHGKRGFPLFYAIYHVIMTAFDGAGRKVHYICTKSCLTNWHGRIESGWTRINSRALGLTLALALVLTLALALALARALLALALIWLGGNRQKVYGREIGSMTLLD